MNDMQTYKLHVKNASRIQSSFVTYYNGTYSYMQSETLKLTLHNDTRIVG